MSILHASEPKKPKTDSEASPACAMISIETVQPDEPRTTVLNLLVTNTRYPQAYDIIRSLRPHANKIVAETYGRNFLAARSTHAANSRLVDKWCRVPSPVADWKAGNIQEFNTEREEAYVQAVLAICAREDINTIYPSSDPHVYVFSKNKERFAERGILIPVPDLPLLIVLLDKLRCVVLSGTEPDSG